MFSWFGEEKLQKMKIAVIETEHFQYGLTQSELFEGEEKIFFVTQVMYDKMHEYNSALCNGEFHVIVKWEHRTPGNLRAFYQVKMKNLKNGKMIENRFRSGEELDVVRMETRNFQFLYHDGTGYVFMDNDNYFYHEFLISLKITKSNSSLKTSPTSMPPDFAKV